MLVLLVVITRLRFRLMFFLAPLVDERGVRGALLEAALFVPPRVDGDAVVRDEHRDVRRGE
ncbi:hypothetical protein D3C83_283740 [compost metagenome]